MGQYDIVIVCSPRCLCIHLSRRVVLAGVVMMVVVLVFLGRGGGERGGAW